MKEILERYHEIGRECAEKKKAIEDKLYTKAKKIEELEAKLERARKEVQKYEDQIHNLHRPSTYDDLIEPLAKKLSEHFGMEYEIYGPFGYVCETSICLRKDMSKSITEQPTISITLRPASEGSMLRYDTGKRTNQYPVGSVAWMNNENAVYAPLPMEFEEILKLVTNGFEKGDEDND